MQKVYRTSEHICKFQKKGRRPKQPSEKPVTIKNATSTERGQIRTLRDFCLNVAKNKKCFYGRYAFFFSPSNRKSKREGSRPPRLMCFAYRVCAPGSRGELTGVCILIRTHGLPNIWYIHVQLTGLRFSSNRRS